MPTQRTEGPWRCPELCGGAGLGWSWRPSPNALVGYMGTHLRLLLSQAERDQTEFLPAYQEGSWNCVCGMVRNMVNVYFSKFITVKDT